MLCIWLKKRLKFAYSHRQDGDYGGDNGAVGDDDGDDGGECDGGVGGDDGGEASCEVTGSSELLQADKSSPPPPSALVSYAQYGRA